MRLHLSGSVYTLLCDVLRDIYYPLTMVGSVGFSYDRY